MSDYIVYYENELQHHGILGQKWGVRRFQNKDGTLTAAGREREYRRIKKYQSRLGTLTKAGEKKSRNESGELDLKFLNKYYRDSNGNVNGPAYARSMRLLEDAEQDASYANEHSGGRTRGERLFNAEKALRDYSLVSGKSFDDVKKELDIAKNSRQDLAVKLAENALNSNHFSSVDDEEITFNRRQANIYKTLSRTLDKYVSDIPDTSKYEKKCKKILDRYDMALTARQEELKDGRKTVWDD